MVEHNRYQASILRHIFSIGGIREVHHASDAISALETLRACPIDVAVVDDLLPGITALELTSLIRTAPDSPNTALPIIVITGRPTKRYVDEALRTGVNSFVKQPLAAGVLLERIKWTMDQPTKSAVSC